jgi:hypothetical protein
MQLSPHRLDSSFISFYWYDPTGVALSSELLPTSFDPFDFAQYELASVPTFAPIWIKIEDSGLATPADVIRYTLAASIESATIRVVPEPTACGLTIIALVVESCSRFARPFFN